MGEPKPGPSQQHSTTDIQLVPNDPQPGPSGLCKVPKPGPSRHYIDTDESSDTDTDVLLKHQIPPGISVPYGSCQVWSTLPEEIKQDPSLAEFKEAFRLLHGQKKNDLSNLQSSHSKKKSSPANHEILSKIRAITPEIHIWPAPDDSDSPILSRPSRPSNKHSSEHENASVTAALNIVEDDTEDILDTSPHKRSKLYNFLKRAGLLIIWFGFTVILMTKSEHDINNMHQISVPPHETRSYWILQHPSMRQISVDVEGALLPDYYGNLSSRYLFVWLELVQTRSPANHSNMDSGNIFYKKRITDHWIIPLAAEDTIDFVPEVRQRKLFDVMDIDLDIVPQSVICLQFQTNLEVSFPVSLSFDLSPINTEDGIVCAAAVLLGLYVLIIFEVVHRTLAAMLAATMSVAILAIFDERPTQAEMVSWIDMETLLLLFSMMVLVAIFSETGIFDYFAVLAYKITNGQVWPLINTLCFFTAMMSSFLDNVTTVLLMTPVTIRLCEVMELNPVPILMAMIIFSNFGGAITPIGDPPNVIIVTNDSVVKSGVSFGVFTLHMGIGLIGVMITSHFMLRFMYRNMKDLRFTEPQDVQELRHEIAIWQRAAASLSSYSKDEDLVRDTLMKKIRRLLTELKRKLLTGSVPIDTYKAHLEELTEKFPIRDRVLLVKSSITLVFVIVMFFLHSIPSLNLSLGWTALLGALLLLLLADTNNMEGILARVEWSTLIFFTSLFILMEALSRLGLIDYIGHQTEQVILSVDKDNRLAVAIILILWVSAIASSFVDNIPLTTMMVRIVVSLNQNKELDLPLQPLVWALALGACLGGNGTLIGASANVVCAGVAEQHGYRFSFMEFLKIGFPVMLCSVTIASAYLIIAHVIIQWNNI